MSRPVCLDRRVVVLFTSVGNEALHGFVSALRREAPLWVLLGTDMSDASAGFGLCDDGWTVPSRSADDYLLTIERIVAEHGVDLVYPLSTRDQDYFADPAVAAQLGVPIVVNTPQVLAAANTKVGLFEAVGDDGLLPPHRTVRDADTAEVALGEIVAMCGAAVFKRDLGTGGGGMLFVGVPPADAAPVAGRELLTVSEAAQRLRAESGPFGVAQVVGWLPGEEYSVDVLADAGVVLGGVVRLRRASIGGLATDSETVEAPDVFAAAETVVQRCGLSYVSNVQFRRDAEGLPKLMEVNPRIPGTVGLTVEAGLNLPLAAAVLALGERPEVGTPEIGVRVLRHSGAVYSRTRPTSFTSPPPMGTLTERLAALRPDASTAILWDLDGTLVHLRIAIESVRSWKQTLQERFGATGWTGGWSPILPSIERALDHVAAVEGAAAAARWRRETYDDLDRWEVDALSSVDPIPEGLECARRWRSSPTAIVTNNGSLALAAALPVLDAAGLATEGLPLVHRGPQLPAKPSAAMFQVALERLGQRSSGVRRVLVIGDSPGDAAAAKALAQSCAVPVQFVAV